MPSSLLVVFLDDLGESRVVELIEFGQIVDICNHIGYFLLEGLEDFCGRRICRIQCFDGLIDLAIHSFDSSYNLCRFDLLKREDLVELALEYLHKGRLGIFCPGAIGGLEPLLYFSLETIVIEILILEFTYKRLLQASDPE